MNYEAIRKNPKQFLSVTALTVENFDLLLEVFELNLENTLNSITFNGKPRKNKYTARKKDILPTPEIKLFFILSYLKNNSLQEHHAASFNMTQDICNKWIHFLTPIVKQSLKEYLPKEGVIPQDISQSGTLLMDATERTVQRDTYEQENYYSGKKKRHTVKNLAIVSLTGIVLWISSTVEGKIHDKKLADSVNLPNNIALMADLGFKGLEKEKPSISLPHKKPKNGELSDEQKQENKEHSGKRVKVEHTFCGIKICRIVKDTCRCTRFGIRHLVFQIACGLHNFRRSNKN